MCLLWMCFRFLKGFVAVRHSCLLCPAVHDLLGRVPGAQEATALHVAADLLPVGGCVLRKRRRTPVFRTNILHLYGVNSIRNLLFKG